MILKNNSTQFIALFITLFFSVLIVLLNKDLPEISMLLVNLILCIFITFIFSNKLKFILISYPFVLYAIAKSLEKSFLSLGDGEGYGGLVDLALSFYTSNTNIFQFIYMLIFDPPQHIYLGVIPVYLVPDILYISPKPEVYYYWQSYLHILFITICAIIGNITNAISKKVLFCIIFFYLFSPTFFLLGFAPTRHYLTADSILLFYISFMAFRLKPSLPMGLLISFSIFLIFISKPAILLLLIVFISYFYFNIRYLVYAPLFSLFLIYIIGPDYFLKYLVTSTQGAGVQTFSGIMSIPALNFPLKLIYALLGPFPWYKYSWHIENIFGGSELIFIISIGSVITGLFFVFRLIFYSKDIFKNEEIRNTTIFGLIMSLAIMGGASGFHGYLAIYFPFFAPLILLKLRVIHLLAPIVFIICIELLAFLVIGK